jgi:hypothetical protein
MFEMAKSLFMKLKAASGGQLNLVNASGGFFLRTSGKTADYTCLVGDSGTIFTTRGATGAVIFTLPTATYKGWWAIFVAGAAQNLTVTNGTVDTLIALADVDADGLAIDANQPGNAIFVFCDGTRYHASMMANLATDFTVAT